MKALAGVALIVTCGFATVSPGCAAAPKATPPAKSTPAKQTKTVASVMEQYGDAMRTKLKPIFAAANVAYPPKEMTWIGLKQEKVLLLFAKDERGTIRQVRGYPIIGASGVAGPKLKEGDLQVPEGFYKIDGFRPNVIAHLGLSVNYPNAEDRLQAKRERRTNLGCDILVHGSQWSTGCLAMGNEPIEEMFVMAHDAGCENISLILAPYDLRYRPNPTIKNRPKWLPELYERLRAALRKYPMAY